ncbi:DUF2255 family protein [Kribbella kalugense]|uniref:DUF2255 family protein n=1 Tax=Kribbella kalugense TaxID=2512221 RepID=A0A4R8A1S7_9ACTN|nr:DUF2255 family protein [Kribbella kalugense]TDW24463.1 hypothetical protein EV650_3342 [Kribbella kalugense]
MTSAWSSDELERIGRAEELHIAPERGDGTLLRETPVWVVRVDDQVDVRTWYRRENGWFGRVVDSRRARIHVVGLQAQVVVEDVDDNAELQAVDAAYPDKYGRYGEATVAQMTTPEASATTLRLVPLGPLEAELLSCLAGHQGDDREAEGGDG